MLDAAGNPIPDTATPRPGKIQATMVQLPQQNGAVPQGVTQEMLEFFDSRTDDKIRASIHGLHIRTREQAEDDYRREFRNKVLLGAGAFVGGLLVSYGYRKWRGDDDADDGGDDDGMDDNE